MRTDETKKQWNNFDISGRRPWRVHAEHMSMVLWLGRPFGWLGFYKLIFQTSGHVDLLYSIYIPAHAEHTSIYTNQLDISWYVHADGSGDTADAAVVADDDDDDYGDDIMVIMTTIAMTMLARMVRGIM